MSGSFTCVTCRVQYGDGDAQRLHYKSDWHRYNLKRKVASLPPVTEAAFAEKSAKLGTATTPATSVDAATTTILRCAVCNKNFNTENALQSHLASKKHKDAVSASTRKSVGSVGGESTTTTSVSAAAEEGVVVKIVKKKATTEDKDKRSRVAKESQNKKAKLMALRANKAKGAEEEDETDDDDEWESDDDDDDGEGELGAYSADEESMADGDGGDGEDEEEDDLPFGDGDPIVNTRCLFCSAPSSTVENNLKHMSSEHSFFVPDLEYLVDVEGLLTYLGEKVGCGFLCLWCNEKGKAFQAVEAAQAHMRDKGHTKMLHEGDALFEYADFYDYRPSYPDYDPEKGVETDMEVECSSKSSQGDDDDEVEVEEVDGDGYTLVLPSGATVGHRSLLRYYKQSLNPRFHGSNALVTKHRTAVQKLMSHYKALGWAGCTGQAAKVKAKDIHFAQKAFQKNRMRLGVKANIQQHHYREQVLY